MEINGKVTNKSLGSSFFLDRLEASDILRISSESLPLSTKSSDAATSERLHWKKCKHRVARK